MHRKIINEDLHEKEFQLEKARKNFQKIQDLQGINDISNVSKRFKLE